MHFIRDGNDRLWSFLPRGENPNNAIISGYGNISSRTHLNLTNGVCPTGLTSGKRPSFSLGRPEEEISPIISTREHIHTVHPCVA